jgi:AmmeMemoRadiSam system protein B/AmmeMemoRadiSam system protein A
MNKRSVVTLLAIAMLLASSACFASGRGGSNPAKVRPAAVAGSFYPADAAQLTKMLDAALAEVPAATGERVVALIAPHAGYEYSARVAAYSYARIAGANFKRVVVIGPSHIEAFGYSSVYDGQAYTTPLGQVAVDREFAKKLAKADPSIRLSGMGHDFTAGARGEHSVEVQLPFLQKMLGQFVVVPVVMGDQSYEASRALGVALAELLKNDKETLIVASSDLSHYHDYATATAMDGHLLKAATDGDYFSISRNNEVRVWEACGAAPIVAAMIASERLGAAHPRLLKYANSGDVTGDKTRVVGYGALVMTRSGDNAAAEKYELSEAEKTELLRIARASVETAVREHRAPKPQAPASSRLLEERGVFVTLKSHGNLRGCIGYTSARSPLYQAVSETAVYAALRDTRFAPVRPEELGDLTYEISVLSPFRRVLDPRTVKVGEHGLLIRRGERSGVLLPQVPVEQHWDRVTFLDEASMKAGLPAKTWEDPQADIFSFTALVFGEEKKAAH